MSGGPDVVLRNRDLPLGVDNHRGPDKSLVRLAIVLLLAPGRVRLGDGVVRVGQQGESRPSSAANLASLSTGSGEIPTTS